LGGRRVMDRNDVPVIVVSWNSGQKLVRWLDAVQRFRPPLGFKIRPVVVDNASSDITATIIGDAVSVGRVRAEDVHWLPANFGFVAAQNVVLRHLMAHTSCRWLATLNDDATADEDWLKNLVSAATSTHPRGMKVGMFGGPIYDPLTSRISSSGHWMRRQDAAFLDIDRNLEAGEKGSLSSREGFEPFATCFAAALWSVAMLKSVGLPDSEQFAYYDDVELAYKARLEGWRVSYAPEARAWHPLPQPKERGSLMWRHQCKGRLAIVCRYLPERERRRILEGLSEEQRQVYNEMISEDRTLTPIDSDELRAAVWDEWADRNQPAKRDSA